MPGCAPPLAFWLAFAFGWKKANDVEMSIAHLWKRVAYACRYGNASITEASNLPMEQLGGFLNALSEIVEEENAANKF